MSGDGGVSAAARAPGLAVGPYRLVAPIGRGGFSEVWRAERTDGEEPRRVALKLLIHPEHVRQLRQEMKALGLVRGGGIARVLDADLACDPPWVALELLEGGDLRARLQRAGGRLEPGDAVAIVQRVLAILGRVHAEGIVHGDLKPENVLFDHMMGLHLADFGLSRQLVQRTASLSLSLSREDARLAGTIDYMAPEQRAGEKPTPRSDVHAVGVMLYELLAGTRPQGVFAFPGESDARIPSAVDRALACALASDPRHRFATASAMATYLRTSLEGDWREIASAQRQLHGILQDSEPATWLGVHAVLFAVLVAVSWVAKLPGRTVAIAGVAGLDAILLAASPWLLRWHQGVETMRGSLDHQMRGWRGR